MSRGSENSDWDRLRATAFRAPWLSYAEERELLVLAHEGNRPALEKLCRTHLRLVVQIASRHRRSGVQADDLVSEGSIGLIEAVDRFDLAKTTRLSTYAAWWIRARVRRHIFLYRSVVTPPSTLGSRVARSRLSLAERVLLQRFGRTPTSVELADELGIDEDEVWHARTACEANLSLGDDVNGFIWEPRDESATPEEQVARRELRHCQQLEVRAALATLAERDRKIISAHFLNEETSMADVGSDLGVSRQRVSQIVKRVCKELERDLRVVALESTL